MGKGNTGELVFEASEAESREDLVDALGKALGLEKRDPSQDGDPPQEAIASDSAGVAMWSLRQVGDRIDVDFDLAEDLIRLREAGLGELEREADAILEDLGRVQAELLKTKDEVMSGLNALEPGARDPSKALGLADSLVGRLDLITMKMEALVAEAQQRGEGIESSFMDALDRAADELWRTQQEAVFAFLEIFEATW